MLSRDSEDEMWSRLMFELLIWPQEITLARWTQASGPLCLWQCFNIRLPLRTSGGLMCWGNWELILEFGMFCTFARIQLLCLEHLLNSYYFCCIRTFHCPRESFAYDRKFLILLSVLSEIVKLASVEITLLSLHQHFSSLYKIWKGSDSNWKMSQLLK